ncbi:MULTISPECIES: thioredoxin family protein [Cylindrospermopsis]|uniref:Thioredoxin family protein n=1 Tax=Cylindrospermopsis curvispora GIHE-G1 TaxID=2666332 RepID=A0A7H0EX17_9CYAN|nr:MULTISPECIES: thioredoxin family protein [Cylindrospermopsis]MBU6346978.1 thioredoxin family protein [Cyanobacteria bacterium REEB494]KRH95392.1 alkyl hydroperoxide reductase [Cylindrospermopsis sp. CR12]QNP28333.1 thioredoxin family protein [Cylindrospermopsis curvispora GIHE-G1]TPX28011.1 thioredoxin family protein [Cylindrospermopsis raciborskii GIHE 2018]UJL34682.1 thioredoxin family protein [Cylindrospermopsis raciborskii Cr2010]
MVRTASTMLPLGTLAPDFNLPDVVSNKTVSLADFAHKKGLLVIFLSRHCPFVQHIKLELAQLGKDYLQSNLGIVAISANDINSHPDDAPEFLKSFAQELDLTYPLLFDETQKTAKDFFAACTPDFFLFDGERKLSYRGQLDDSRPGNNEPVNGKDLRAAINAVLSDREVNRNQKPSIGCNIKWRLGNEPVYFQNQAIAVS